jgi:uncharacterized protein YoxC
MLNKNICGIIVLTYFYFINQILNYMENNQGGGNKKVYIAIIVLLFLINAVAIYLLLNEKKDKEDVTASKVELQSQYDSLTTTMDQKVAELEQFKGKNAELDSMIVTQQQEIEKQKAQIQGMLAKGNLSQKELAKAKAAIAQYEASIAELQKKVEELTKQNQELTTQNEQLSTDLNNEKATTNQLSETNKGLSKKVELGSLLQLQKLTVEGIKKKSNGKEVTVNRAKTTESLKITFETGENKVLEPGNLSLYIRVLNPKGETISVADQGSGTLKSADGETIQFSKKADFDWSQSNKKIVVYWSQNIQSAGTYKVEVYQSGYVVGKGQLELK